MSSNRIVGSRALAYDKKRGQVLKESGRSAVAPFREAEHYSATWGATQLMCSEELSAPRYMSERGIGDA